MTVARVFMGIVACSVLAGALPACGDGDGGREHPSSTSSTSSAASTTADAGGPAGAAASGRPPENLRLVEVGQFEAPVYMLPVPGSDSVAVVQKGGDIVVAPVREDGSLGDDRSTLLDIGDEVSDGSEQGLLGAAFHPDFERNGRMFIDYTNREGDSRIEEWKVDPPDASGTARKVRTLLAVDQPYENHNGGEVAFGPDGMLWIGFGDGGSAGDPHGNGQDPGTLLGKLLRIDVDAKPGQQIPYGVPDGNLPASGETHGEVWSIGLRNPWRFTFDRETQDLWIGDVGQGKYEEIDAVSAMRLAGGRNFGWNAFEGTEPYEGGGPLRRDGQPVTEPVHQYTHDDGCSITGGYVYRGSAIPRLRGWYVFADFCSDWIRVLRTPGSSLEGWTASKSDVREYEGVPQVSSFAEGADGELYALALDGPIYALRD